MRGAKRCAARSGRPKRQPPARSVCGGLAGSHLKLTGSTSDMVAAQAKKAGAKQKAVAKPKAAPPKLTSASRIAKKTYTKQSGTPKCGRKSCSATPSDREKWCDYVVQSKRDGSQTHWPVGNSCGACDKVYTDGFENFGTRDEVYEMCNADPHFDQSFNEAKALLHADTRPFYSSNVKKRQRMGMRAALRYRGLTPEEFQIAFGRTHVEAKRKLMDLVVPSSALSCFKGILLRDHPKLVALGLGVEYEYWVEVCASESEVKLDHRRQLRESQGKEYYSELVKPSGLEDPELKQLRLCTLTVEDIEATIGKLNEGLDSLASQDQDADDDTADDGNAEGTLALGDQLPHHTPRKDTKPKHVLDASPSMIIDNGIVIATTKPVAIADAGSVADGQLADDCESEHGGQHVDVVQARIDAINLTAIASGAQRFGHKRVRMTALRDKHCLSDDKDLRDIAARFTERLDLALIAEEMSKSENIAVWTRAQRHEKIGKLVVAGMVWACSTAMDLLSKECSDRSALVFQGDASILEVARICAPWPPHTANLEGGSDEDAAEKLAPEPEEFDPLNPALRCIPGTHKDTANRMETLLYVHIITPFVKECTSASATNMLAKLVHAERFFLDIPTSLPDELVASASSFVRFVRCVKHLLDPTDTIFASSFDALYKAAPAAGEWQGLLYLSYSLLKDSQFFKPRILSLIRTKGTHMDALRDIGAKTSELKEASALQAKCQVLLTFVGSIAQWRKNTRAGSMTSLLTLASTVVDTIADDTLEFCGKDIDSSADLPTVTREYSQRSDLMKKALDAAVGSQDKLKFASERCCELIPKLTALNYRVGLAPFLAGITGSELYEEGPRATVEGKLLEVLLSSEHRDRHLLATETEVAERVLKEVVIAAKYDVVDGACTLSKVVPVMEKLSEFLSDTKRKTWCQTLRGLSAIAAAAEALAKYTGSGAAAADRVKADAGFATLADLMAMHKGLKTYEVGDVDLGTPTLPNLDLFRATLGRLISEDAPVHYNTAKNAAELFAASIIDDEMDGQPMIKDVVGFKCEGWSWAANIKGGSYKAVVDAAKKQLLQVRPGHFRKACDGLQARYDDVKKARETFEVPPDAEWEDMYKTCVTKAAVLMSEGQLCGILIKHKSNDEKLKTEISKVKNKCVKLDLWGKIHPKICDLADSAISLMPLV